MIFRFYDGHEVIDVRADNLELAILTIRTSHPQAELDDFDVSIIEGSLNVWI